MRRALSHKSRYIGTPKVSKHRFFVWLTQEMLASNLVIAIASDEDYMLGILSSSIHESWARRLGSQLRESHSGGTYTPTTCFETFPFPRPTEQQRAAIGKEAEELNRLREGWLNPPDASEPELKKRTLTNLYNARPTWLQMVHQRLDKAVLDAYGWPHDLTGPEILERLLALNLERAIS
jgi:type II restriction/modification system DNA methylase subunit YeeA